MSENKVVGFQNQVSFSLPPVGNMASGSLDLTIIKNAEARIPEARLVNPATYGELEDCFNAAYRDLKKHMANVGYLATRQQREIDKYRGKLMISYWSEFMLGKPKGVDSTDMRNSWFMQDEQYLKELEKLDYLKSLDIFLEGRIKVMENTCRYLRKIIDLIIRSGTNVNYRST